MFSKRYRNRIREIDENRKQNIIEWVDKYNSAYGEGTATHEMKDQYYNMREKIEPVMHIIDIAFEAMEAVGVKPNVKPIRGGTDGAQLSFKGLPCPNIFAGGLNFHGRFEFIPIQNMDKAQNVCVKIAELVAEQASNIQQTLSNTAMQPLQLPTILLHHDGNSPCFAS